MSFFRKSVNKMINLDQLWKNLKVHKKFKRNIKEITFQEINTNEYKIIDVRSRREYAENHLNTAINVPLPEIKTNIEKYIKDKNKKILIYCQTGVRSKKASEILENLGYTNVYNLKGGLENI